MARMSRKQQKAIFAKKFGKVGKLTTIPSKDLNPIWKGVTIIESSGKNEGRIIIDQVTRKQASSLIKDIKKLQGE